MRQFFFLSVWLASFPSGRADGHVLVNVLGEWVPSKADRPGEVVTNFTATTADGLYAKSEWQFSSDTGVLSGVRKYSKTFKGGLSALEKRRLMTEVQHQMLSECVGLSTVLKEEGDSAGEIESDDGLSAKIAFVKSGDGVQMVVDVSITREYLLRAWSKCPKNRRANPEGLVRDLFKLSPSDLSTNGVGVCRFNANGVRDGFRFLRPKTIANAMFSALMCSFDSGYRLQGISLYKIVSGEDCLSKCQKFADSLETMMREALGFRKGMMPQRVEADGRRVCAGKTGDGMRMEISWNADSSFGVVELNLAVDDE